MVKHALLGASSSHRWLKCTPSARVEETIANRSNKYADEGSAAHALAEHKLREFLKIPTEKPTSEYDSPEMETYTDTYVTYACELISEARSRSDDAIALIEQRLDYSEFVAEGFGTGDLVIVSDGILDVLDLKYGMQRVSAHDNPQLMLYGLAALTQYGFLYEIRTVRMTICQPRLDAISTFILPADKLLAWAEQELKPKADLAYKGEGEFTSGDHCRYCRAGATCRARAKRNQEMARLDFKDPPLLTDDEVAEVLGQVDEIAAWAKTVWAYAEEEAISGRKQFPGFKVVEVKGSRKYTDETKVAKRLLSTGEYDESQIYTKKVLGITALTQLIGKKQFNTLLWDLCVSPPGKPGLVVDTDKRQDWNRNRSAKFDFKGEL